jgi:MFS family permease
MSSYGIMTSLGAFQSYFATHQLSNYSSRDIGWITGLFVFMAFMLGVQVGPLFDRHGPRGIVLIGSACHVTSLFLFAECKIYWQFLLCFGLLTGGSAALLSTAALSVIPQYFQRRAGLAMGLAMTGSGIGGVIFPFILRAGWSQWGWKWGIRLFAFLILALSIPPMLFVKPRLPKGRARGTVDLTCFKDSRFTFLTLGLFCTSPFSGARLYNLPLEQFSKLIYSLV